MALREPQRPASHRLGQPKGWPGKGLYLPLGQAEHENALVLLYMPAGHVKEVAMTEPGEHA